jgi:signal transduction histidine kinase
MTTTPRAAHRVIPLLALAARRRLSRWWRNTPVRRKFLSVVFVSMLVCIPPAAVAVVLEVRLNEVRSQTEATTETVGQIDALQETLTEADTAVRYFAILGFDEVRYVHEFRAAAAAVREQLAVIGDEVSGELAGPASEVMAASEAQLGELDAIVAYVPTAPLVEDPPDEVVANGGDPSLLDGLLAGTSAAEAAHDATRRLRDRVNLQLSSDRAEVDRIESHLVWATLVSLAAALAVVAAGGVVVTAGIVRRIERLSENGRRRLRGEPMLPMGEALDEIGRLTDDIGQVGELLDERRREAVAATRAKDEFLWSVSHELRAPLTAIIGFGELLAHEGLTADDLDSARRIVGAGSHLLALIDDLLDIARIEAGHLAVAAEPVVVEEVAAEVTSLVGSMAAARSLTLTSDCPRDLVVTADRRRLAQVLINMLTNAVKYNSRSGGVSLAAMPGGDVVRISVADTGPGISPTDLDRLFRPYERLDAAVSGVEGSGIGLALTKQLVEAMGGTIGVQTVVGRGTTFWVDLPRHASPSAVPPSPGG